MLIRPAHIKPTVCTEKLSFSWGKRTGMNLTQPDSTSLEVAKALRLLNVKANVAVGVACLEWVMWRLEGHVELGDPLLRLEAAWASTETAGRAGSLDFEFKSDLPKAEDVCQTAMVALQALCTAYQKHRINVGMYAGNAVMVATHVLPKSSGFEPWLDRVFKALAKRHPEDPTFDRKAKKFDSSHQAAVPRQWFEAPSARVNAVEDSAAWAAFIGALDPKNPYLAR